MAQTVPLPAPMPTPAQLRAALSDTAWAYRGYNLTNLGRSAELFAVPAYQPHITRRLEEASAAARDFVGRPIDLVSRVREARETSLESYADAVALIVAMELAQLDLLKEFFDIEVQQGRFSFGYSLGEIAALAGCGVIDLRTALETPLRLADDCAALAHNVTLGILFSRGPELSLDRVRRLCVKINAQGQGVIGISSYLSPNSVLLMGQAETIDRFSEMMKAEFGGGVHLRKNRGDWPPMHTPIIWQKNIPCRAAQLMHTMTGAMVEPRPPILSFVTGKFSYNDYNAREILHKWTDHPQRMWDVVYETLAVGIKTIVHIGPDPNIIPATFARVSENVRAQTSSNLGMRALAAAARRPWLSTMLPSRTALLRAPQLQHVILEDWLLANAP